MYSLEKELAPPPVLTLPQLGVQRTVETDKCITKVSYFLLRQQKDRSFKPLNYRFSSQWDAETRHDTTHKEFLTVAYAMLQFFSYQKGAHVVVRADFSSARWILDREKFTGRLAKWRLHHIKLSYEVVNWPGVHHQAINAMSLPHEASRSNAEKHGVDIEDVITAYHTML